MATKAQLTSQLKKLNIPIPISAKAEDMQHRLSNWKSGDGYHVRLLRNPRSKHEGHPVTMLKDRDTLYWMPSSKMAEQIISSHIVLVLDRTNEPSNDAIVLDVPSDYDSRWNNGSNDNADS
tara:strand:- start:1967 stop:2329 length:363 start_codon:yes stop_codon:yes gene_type:complete